ncbi:hypothetical protein C4K09_2453 [Pseudomonas chlororaphis subsp. aureofaciens]|nr:hypothetical protein C4K18_2486 [Pseudomonas chlororaphis subsp. aurantiaca]AZE16914.1 hypothetical protein C4K09_2453 [Pseudomonas chlororaphis subsp. aureofaciens]
MFSATTWANLITIGSAACARPAPSNAAAQNNARESLNMDFTFLLLWLIAECLRARVLRILNF